VLELGGKSPTIVDGTLSSQDLDMAAKRIAWGAFSNAGQTCVRPDYILVDASIGASLVAHIRRHVLAMYSETPQQSDSYGRLINHAQFARLTALLAADRRFLVHGGECDEKDRFMAPALLDFQQDWAAFTASAVMQDEIFGPILPMVYYTDLNQVLKQIMIHVSLMMTIWDASACESYVCTDIDLDTLGA
jgi:aldehyde dehydrogenase (NAD+)